MILYHGTTMEIPIPRILRSEIGRDFGLAFYTTDIQEQAERWAKRKARIENRRHRKYVKPVVNVYEWKDDLSALQIKRFEDASLEWLEMVVRCRGDSDYQHGYDIVEGKIANDNVGETVSYVMQGIMRKEDAVERLRFEKINNQIAFCSERALAGLTFLRSYEVEG
jgi:hypothetical protein